MKLGIHSAPDWASTGSDSGASSSTRPAGGVVDHQRDELFHRIARRLRARQGRHRPGADVVVDRPHVFVAVAEALVEVALGQPGLPAHRPHGERRAARTAEQFHPGGDQVAATQRLAILQWNARPAAASLTGGHITP